MNTKSIGTLGELATLFEFSKQNIPVALPYGDNCRYDLIAEFNGKLNKIQIKTTQQDKNGICIFPTISKLNHTTNKKLTSYKNEVDYFVFYAVSLNRIALVPIEDIGDQKTFTLRTNKPKGTNGKPIRYFDDYKFENYL